MQSGNDDLVDISHGERLHSWAGGPKGMVIFDRGDHNNIMEINRDNYFAYLNRFLVACNG